jgi:hypothetical protein
MATQDIVTRDVPVTTRSVGAMSWSAVFAGAVVSLGLWALLAVFGAAAGLSALDPQNPQSARTAGIGTGIWSIIVPLIALFAGGFIAARLSRSTDRTAGGLHGAVLWGLTTIGGILLVGSLLGSLIGGVARLGASGAAAVGSAAGAAPGASGLMQALGLSEQELLAPINNRLRAEGKPEVKGDQLQAALKDVAGSAVRTGDLDRETLVGALAARTALSRADVQELANTIEQRWQSARAQGGERLGAAGEKLQTGALKAGDTTGKVMWGAFGALLLGLVSAVIGGMLGARAVDRTAARPRTIPVGTPAEVHP